MSAPRPESAAGLGHLSALRAPVAIRSLDLSAGFKPLHLPASRSGAPYCGLAVLVWNGDQPIGWLGLKVPSTGEVAGEVLEQAFGEQLAPADVGARHGEALPAEADCPPDSLLPAFVSHVVTTCDQPAAAVRCVRSIVASEGGPFEVVVVENRPAHSMVGDALRSAFPGDGRMRVVDEPVAGLSRARNAGLRAAAGEIVAFTDDDIVVDPRWAGALRRAFARRPDVACVTGPILPAALETSAQLLMERFATLGKGFVRRSYSAARPPDLAEQPLFPYTAGYFGSGGNAALRREALAALDGFDPVLGAGTPARGGEDLDLFIRLVLAGETMLYEPGVVVWHPHPETMDRLSREVFDYGVGLGAMLTNQLVAGADRLGFIEKIPRGVRYLTSPASRKNASKGSAYPRRLDRLERLGLMTGPAAYACSRAQTARLRATRARS